MVAQPTTRANESPGPAILSRSNRITEPLNATVCLRAGFRFKRPQRTGLQASDSKLCGIVIFDFHCHGSDVSLNTRISSGTRIGLLM